MTTPPASPPAAQTREPGWYWAKMTADSNWRPLLWQHGDWYDQPVGFAYVGPPFAEIGPRIPTPAERAGDALEKIFDPGRPVPRHGSGP